MNHGFQKLSDFVDWLTAPELRDEQPAKTHWFRGHPHTGLDLRPGILRQRVSDALRAAAAQEESRTDGDAALEAAEIEINRQFRRAAASLVPAEPDPVELYFQAQHHGLPTRLLDWTTNGLAALFFTAVNHPDEDGEVIVTSPDWRLTTDDSSDPRLEVLHEAPFSQWHPLVRGTAAYLFGDGTRPEEALILPVLPALKSRRMFQQGACFTFHLPGSGAIDENAVTRMTIPGGRKRELVRSLRLLGLDWSTLFPDLDHLCLEIRERWLHRDSD